MISLNLENLETAKELCKICDKYKDEMYVDVLYKRYTIDGCSMLGVASLLGHIIEIKPCTDDERIINLFTEEIKRIGAYTG